MSPTSVKRLWALGAVALLLGVVPAWSAAGAAGAEAVDLPAADGAATTRLSVGLGGAEANGLSDEPAITPDGRFVAFSSRATNLVPGDTNGVQDIFVLDRQTGTTERVSVSSGGVQGDKLSMLPDLSADGRYIVFRSDATNLVASDTNNRDDIFVHDRTTDVTERISISTGGTQGNWDSSFATISDNGRYVAFASAAGNLVPGDGIGNDIFLRDRQTGTTQGITFIDDVRDPNGESIAPRISADGTRITFSSYASNLVVGDTNGEGDAFLYDRAADSFERISVANGGAEGSEQTFVSDISADGSIVAFYSAAPEFSAGGAGVQSYVWEEDTGDIEQVSVATGGTPADDASYAGDLSDDGRYVTLESSAGNLAPGDVLDRFDVFLRDRDEGTTVLISQSTGGGVGNDDSSAPVVTNDGRKVVYGSEASNLIAGDTNTVQDLFLTDLDGAEPETSGYLRVTTSPAVPAQIIVDGVARDSWGLTWVPVDVGDHEVCFGPVGGFSPPPCEVVQVEAGETAELEGAYQQRGFLRVTTTPAVPSTITVDGVPRNDWGVWTEVDPGTYEVCFGPVAGFDPPACQDVVVPAGVTAVANGSFTPDGAAPGPSGPGGRLRVTTNPASASRITVDGEWADSWGLTWTRRAPGSYEVCFESVLYATAPDCETAVVTDGNTTVVEGGFVPHGFLQVSTSPAVPAVILIDGEWANAWGAYTSLEPGGHLVCYEPVDGFDAPACDDVDVTAGETTSVVGTYTPT